MTSVSPLGYIGIGTSDDTAWKDLATDILGMQGPRGEVEGPNRHSGRARDGSRGQTVHAARVPGIARMR